MCAIQFITTLGIRPLLVADGNQVICRDSSSFKDMQIVSKMKRSIGKAQRSRRLSCCQTRASSSGGDGGAFHSQICDLYSGFDDIALMHCFRVFFIFHVILLECLWQG